MSDIPEIFTDLRLVRIFKLRDARTMKGMRMPTVNLNDAE